MESMIEPSQAASSEDACNSLALDDQLCFAVYSTANAFTRLYTALLSRLDLTYTQYLVLVVLWEEEGLTLKEIGARLRLDSGTLTPVLRRLEKRDVITRQRDPADQRRVTTHLTQDGRDLQTRVAEARRQVFLATGLSGAELDQLKGELNDVCSALDRATETLEKHTEQGV